MKKKRNKKDRASKNKAETKIRSKFLEHLEHYNARLIPFAIIILLFIIIVELFFHEFAETYHLPLLILDNLVIIIFIIDLIFLALHARSVKFFFKSYWLDILAVIPIALLFTIFNRIYHTLLAAREIATSQALVHETLEARRAASALAKGNRLAKSIGTSTRIVRVIVKSRLFTQIHHKHHLARRKVFPTSRHNSRKASSG